MSRRGWSDWPDDDSSNDTRHWPPNAVNDCQYSMIGCDGRWAVALTNTNCYRATDSASTRSFGPTAEGSPSDWTR